MNSESKLIHSRCIKIKLFFFLNLMHLNDFFPSNHVWIITRISCMMAKQQQLPNPFSFTSLSKYTQKKTPWPITQTSCKKLNNICSQCTAGLLGIWISDIYAATCSLLYITTCTCLTCNILKTTDRLNLW